MIFFEQILTKFKRMTITNIGLFIKDILFHGIVMEGMTLMVRQYVSIANVSVMKMI